MGQKIVVDFFCEPKQQGPAWQLGQVMISWNGSKGKRMAAPAVLWMCKQKTRKCVYVSACFSQSRASATSDQLCDRG